MHARGGDPQVLRVNAGAGNEAAKARVLVAFGDFPAPLLSVLNHTAASTITEHAYFTHNADSMHPVSASSFSQKNVRHIQIDASVLAIISLYARVYAGSALCTLFW